MLRAVRWIMLAWLLVAVAVIGGVAVLLYRPAIVLGVDGDAIKNSLAGEVAGVSSDAPPCAERGGGWRCRLKVIGRDRNRRYRVRIDDDGCWRAFRAGQGRRRAGRRSRVIADECLGPLDYLR